MATTAALSLNGLSHRPMVQSPVCLRVRLKLNRFKNLKSGRPRIQEGKITLTLKLKAENKEELPLDFTFIKVQDEWRIDRIIEANT